jgi:hypothetical protein
VHRRALLTTLCAFVVVASGGAADSFAQEEATAQRPADIRAGTCASLGDVVMPLASLSVPTGEALGQDGATPAEQSVTTLPLLLDDILTTGHAVAVHASPEQVGTPVACGEIGGALGEDGSLAIGLNAMNGAKISGAAYFAPTPEGDGTTVTLLLIDERAGRRGAGGVGGGSEPVAADPTAAEPAGSDSAAVGAPTTVDNASGVDNATAPPATAPAPAPAPATAGLDGVSTISASNEDGKNAKAARNKDKSTADRDANGNAGNATTDSDTNTGSDNDNDKGKERGGEPEREGGARAGEDGGANG